MSETETTKPPYKTRKFWITASVVLLGLVMASGLFHEGSTVSKTIGWLITVLSSLGAHLKALIAKGE